MIKINCNLPPFKIMILLFQKQKLKIHIHHFQHQLQLMIRQFQFKIHIQVFFNTKKHRYQNKKNKILRHLQQTDFLIKLIILLIKLQMLLMMFDYLKKMKLKHKIQMRQQNKDHQDKNSETIKHRLLNLSQQGLPQQKNRVCFCQIHSRKSKKQKRMNQLVRMKSREY